MSILFRTDEDGNNGSWSLHSALDPRWNTSGRGFIVVMGGSDPPAVAAWMEQCKKQYGPAPADLTYSCMKD